MTTITFRGKNALYQDLANEELKKTFAYMAKEQKRMFDVQQVANAQIASLLQEMAKMKCRCDHLETKLTAATLQINGLTSIMTTTEMLRQLERNTFETCTHLVLKRLDTRLRAIELNMACLLVSQPSVHVHAYTFHSMPLNNRELEE